MAIHVGMGAVLILFVLAVVLFVLRKRRQSSPLLQQMDSAVYVLLVAGLVGICLAVLSPFVDFPDTRALFLSPLIRVKAVFAIVVFETLLLMYYMRWKHGPQLWESTPLAAYFVLLGTASMVFVILAGSVGGYLALGETNLEALDQMLGIPIH
jgi:hypothetical protein